MPQIPTLSKPGDVVSTNCIPKLLAIPCHGIRADQRWLARVDYPTRRRGYPAPHWRKSHVGIILPTGEVFEVTHPHAKLTPLPQFVEGKPWAVHRRQVEGNDFDYPDRALTYMHSAAIELLRQKWSRYDVGQLLNHLVMDLFGVPMDKWDRWVDFSARWRVCSAGTAWVEERSRRLYADSLGLPNLGRVLYETPLESCPLVEPWPRAFELSHEPGPPRYIHTERVKPADYGFHSCYRTVETGEAA